jgi:hypothetical protein
VKILIETLILLTLWLIACAVCGAVGFFIGLKGCKSNENKKPPDELTEAQKFAVEKTKREIENFWNYTGDNQETKNNGFNT